MAAVFDDTFGESTSLYAVSVKQTSDIMKTGTRRRLLAYAQFWQRMTDQSITLLIFTVLLALSVLPILQLQTAILFNRAFASILRRKVHKQEVLEDLYTPGLFYQIEAEQSNTAPGALSRTMRRPRSGNSALSRGLVARICRVSTRSASRGAAAAKSPVISETSRDARSSVKL